MRRDKKEEEEGRSAMYMNLERSTVLQESRMFNETPLKVRRCVEVLTKMLVVLNQGEHLGRKEATEAFFAMTKLFQNKDVNLRRMLFLLIKDMADIADDVIIVTSSLMKDMTGKEDGFRAPAIRALCRITDASLMTSIERHMKQAIVDKQPAVSSAALVSAIHFMKTSPDVVKRWSNEVQEATNSDNLMVQFHALGLLYHIRRNDKLAVSKMVQKLSKQNLRSTHATCLLIRIATKLLSDDSTLSTDNPVFEFLESCLRHKSEAVVYEAARAIVSLEQTTSKELAPAVSVLQIFCSSAKPTLRFAAVRTLNLIAMKHPSAVTACNLDLEQLISDSNRSIATLAITTLLKTGAEASVDRLMKQISTFISDINDEFKIVVVQSVRALCSKYPRKHSVMMSFLSQMLRDEGSYQYKTCIVDTIISVLEENSEAREAGLGHLCEFIEDCEHPNLAVKILNLLGQEGPRTMKPSKYIRYIYNRVILEVPSVRAAAVSSLAKFGAAQPDLLPSILVLLERCKMDTDDEVRDRATLYYLVLSLNNDKINSSYLMESMQCSVVGLESALKRYTSNSLSGDQGPFDLKSVPIQSAPVVKAPVSDDLSSVTSSNKPTVHETVEDAHARRLAAVPELSALGTLFKSSSVVSLTEDETEYSVQCIKHVFTSGYVLLQFDLLNTLNDQLLEHVYIQVESSDADWEVVKVIQCQSLPYNQSGVCYVCLQSTEPNITSGNFACTMKFIVKDCDPNTGEADSDEGYQDEYVVEELELSLPDFIRGSMRANFSAAWEELPPESQLEETFSLASIPTLQDAVKQVRNCLGLAACDRGDRVDSGKSTHTMLLSGVFCGGHDVLVRTRMAISSSGVTLNLTVRSSDPALSDLVVSAVG